MTMNSVAKVLRNTLGGTIVHIYIINYAVYVCCVLFREAYSIMITSIFFLQTFFILSLILILISISISISNFVDLFSLTSVIIPCVGYVYPF